MSLRYRIILWISLLLFFGSVFFWWIVGQRWTGVDLAKIIDYKSVNFAGEPVSFEWKYIFNREKFERELSITRYNIYQFVLYYRRSPVYLPYIEKKLKEAWVPDDFKYLAIAESGLNNDALSSASAGWVWQFVPETAKQYGLIVNDSVDERFNFEKATDAAIAYFKKLHDDFHDWTLVAAAYNRWENGLQRALDDQKVTSYYDLYLNNETTRYVFRILAIKYLMIHKNEIFESFDLGKPFEVPDTLTIQVGKIDDLKSWAFKNGYNYAMVRQLNPWIISNNLPDGTWGIKVLRN